MKARRHEDPNRQRRVTDWTTVERLLQDAKMLAAYCERTARLRSNALPRAIANVEKREVKSWSDDAAVALQLALNEALQLAAPVTLVDIRSGWNPDDTAAKKIKRNLAFVALSFILMILAAVYTVRHNQATAVATELEQLVAEEPAARIDEIARSLIVADAEFRSAGKSDMRNLGPDKYFADIVELRALDKRITLLTDKAKESISASYTPLDAAAGLAGYLWTLATTNVEGDLLLAGGVRLQNLPAYNPCYSQSYAGDSGPFVIPAARQVETEDSTLYSRYRTSVVAMLCGVGVATTPFDVPPLARYLREVNDRTNWLGIWFLPALYGAFGAMIYYMRRVLDPNLPDPPVVRMLHRIALGAFSGTILAWLWAPTKMSSGLTDIGLNVFAAAFLVGFSADVFFALLDRLVFLLTRWIRALGAPEKA